MRVRFAVLTASFVLAGCGFRSGVGSSSFEVESFALDQTSYVQGETGTATAVFRNVGPSPSALPPLTFSPGGEDFTFEVVSEPDGDIAPQDTGTLVLSFHSTETAQPRTFSTKLKDANGVILAAVDAQLLFAASVKVNALAFATEGDTTFDYTCRGVAKPAILVATVQNNGASTANIANPRVTVGDGNVAFESHPVGDPPPVSIAPGAIETFHLDLQALGTAAPGNDYVVSWTATITDATTGHDRDEPGMAHEAVYLTVHVPASFELDISESTDTISTGAPGAGPVQLSYQNVGTVSGRIDAATLNLRIADSTNDEYSMSPISVPITVAPQTGGELNWTNVTLTSVTPTLGSTSVGALLDVEDTTCEVAFQQFVPEANRGLWIVE